MDVVQGLHRLEAGHGRLFAVVGVFDGIHRGHAYLLRRLVSEARRRGARPAVITFDAHPDEILTGTAPPLLVDPDERVTRLARAEVAVTVVQHFDRALRETPFDGFVRMISDRTELAGFLMTPDAAFGFERGGTPQTLAALGASSEPPFEVAVVPPFVVSGAPVRSSEIRAAIAAGDLAGARRLLGRDHAVVGAVAAPGRGVRVTFPMPVALPPEGEYTVRLGRPIHGTTRATGRMTTAAVSGGTVRLPAGIRRSTVRIAFARPAVG